MYSRTRFRYAHQNELRFIGEIDVDRDHLDEVELEVDSLHDIGEVIVL